MMFKNLKIQELRVSQKIFQIKSLFDFNGTLFIMWFFVPCCCYVVLWLDFVFFKELSTVNYYSTNNLLFHGDNKIHYYFQNK